MEKRGPDFYDNESVFKIYSSHRESPDTPNDTIEQPILWELIGDARGLTVLDLGCGDARVSQMFRARGALHYLGIEGSRLMVEQSRRSMIPGFSEVIQCWLEGYAPPENHFDLAISSLVLHYIEDIECLMRKVHRSLKPNGRFIFSVEHPVITSCNRSLENTNLRQDWIVDDYFKRGARNIEWMGDRVTLFHRTIEDYIRCLKDAGFTLQGFRESDPMPQNFQDNAIYERRRRIPLLLILEGIKST